MQAPDRGYTRLDNEVLGNLAKNRFTSSEQAIIEAIIRITYGWHKHQAPISANLLIRKTKLSRRIIKYSLANLQAKRVIKIKRRWDPKKGSLPNVVALNPITSSWFPAGYTTAWAQKRRADLSRWHTKHSSPQAPPGGVHLGPKNGQKLVHPPRVHCSAPLLKKELLKETPPTPPKGGGCTSFEKTSGEIIEHWNAQKGLIRCSELTPKRRRQLKRRLQEPRFANNWKLIIDRISKAKCLTGKTKRRARASIAWLIRDKTNYVQVLEGLYHDPVEIAKFAAKKARLSDEKRLRKAQDKEARDLEEFLKDLAINNPGIHKLWMKKLDRQPDGRTSPPPKA